MASRIGRDIGARVRRQLREALGAAPRNVAAAVNVNGEGQVSAVYQDDEVTVIHRNGRTRTIRHEARGDPSP